MILRTLLSHYRRHPVQALFLLTGIVIANVLLVGTLLINSQARASYAEGEQWLSAGPVGQIRSRAADGSFDERDYIRLRRQGFEMLAPLLRQITITEDGEPLELLGIDLFSMPSAGSSEAMTGKGGSERSFAGFSLEPYELWAAPARMKQLGWQPGCRIPLASGRTLPPAYAVPGQDLGHRLLLDIGALQSLTDNAGLISSILVFGAEPDRLQALQDALPGNLEYISSQEAPDPAELTRSFHLNLAAMGLLAFVVGIFLIYNALAFSYTDRRKLIRKLRLAGVTRSELARGLLVELGLFLLAGSLLGFLLGARMASWLLPGVGRTLAQLYDVYISYPDGLVPSGMVLPVLMTLLAAGLCALFPLREALSAPLLERWQAGWQSETVSRRDRLFSLSGTALLVLAGLLGVVAESLWLALAGMASLLLGAALCLPLVLRVLLTGLSQLVPPRFARLSWLVSDSRWLLGPASLALMAMTLALVANSGLNTMISSFRDATDRWLDQRLAAELYLRGSQEMGGLQSWLDGKAADLRMAERYRRGLTRSDARGHSVPVEVVSLQDGERFASSVDLFQQTDDARSRFAAGDGVYVSERAWRIDGWTTGDLLQLCANRDGLPVLGVYHDYGNPKSQWMVNRDLFRQCWPDQAVSGISVYGPQGTDWNRVRAELTRAFGLEDGDIIDQGELKQVGLAVFDRTFTVTQALNALTLLVAGIGIFCAISAIHHHRVGQQALLASLGVTRRERGTLLLLQWGLLGLLCMVLVWPFGTLLAAYLAGVVTPVAFGWSFPLRPEWTHYAELALISAGCLVLAVFLPSLQLLRTTPATMLREQTV